jgi:hypothetical protein
LLILVGIEECGRSRRYWLEVPKSVFLRWCHDSGYDGDIIVVNLHFMPVLKRRSSFYIKAAKDIVNKLYENFLKEA